MGYMGQRSDLTPINDDEKRQFFKQEKEMQPLADEFYRQWGFEIKRNGDKKKDVTLTREGESQTVEEKYRNCYRPDILIEMVQDLSTVSPGWCVETGCDFLHYFFHNSTQLLELDRIDWTKFKPWFFKTYLPGHKIGDYVLSDKGYGLTLNIPVNKSAIPADIINIIKLIK